MAHGFVISRRLGSACHLKAVGIGLSLVGSWDWLVISRQLVLACH